MLSKNCLLCSVAFLIGLAALSPSASFVPSIGSRHSNRIQVQRQSTTSDEQSTTTSDKEKSPVKQSKLPAKTVMGPPLETKPDYENIHGPLGLLADKVFMSVFRTKMATKVGIDSQLPKDDYMGLMELTAAMNARYTDRREVQSIAQDVLRESE